jgi:N-acetylated-alpha-linked acidic dipeptidase
MVLLGGHHDAWTFGGVDPGTGAAVLLEVARGLGRLASTGWRPRRTIALAFWDAEEYGLIGSTEYAEHKRRDLQEQLITYVNTDMYMTGRFDPGGVPSLRDLVVDVARDVPEGEASVYDRWRDGEWRRQGSGRQAAPPDSFEVDLKTLGSGADFVPFQDHLGVPTLSVEFIGANGYGFGPYHSNYDTRAYVERVADPGFAQGTVLARLLGTLAMRMAGAEVLPFRFSHYAARIQADLAAVGKRLPASDQGAMAGLSMLAGRIRETAVALEQDIDRGLATGRLPDSRTPELNDRLARVEQVPPCHPRMEHLFAVRRPAVSGPRGCDAVHGRLAARARSEPHRSRPAANAERAGLGAPAGSRHRALNGRGLVARRPARF